MRLGTCRLRLLDAAEARTLEPGTAINDTLDPANSTQLYSFDVAAGDRLFLDQTSGGGGSTSVRLVDPYGHDVWRTGLGSDMEGEPLYSWRNLSLLVEGYISDTAPVTYGFTLHRVTDGNTPMAIGARTEGALTQPGQKQKYSFSLTDTKQVCFG